MTVNRHCTCKSEVQIPLNLTGEAGDLYYNSTGCPSSLDTQPPAPPFSFYFFFHHFSHPQTPYHTLPSFHLPREICSFLSNNTLFPLRNLSNSEGKLSFIHLSNIRHSSYPPCWAKEESFKKNSRSVTLNVCININLSHKCHLIPI